MSDKRRPMGAIMRHASPGAEKQGTVCSGWQEGALVCHHGHLQTSACNPTRFQGQWDETAAPWCCQDRPYPPQFQPIVDSVTHMLAYRSSCRIEALEAENARLREVLEHQETMWKTVHAITTDMWGEYEALCKHARAALGRIRAALANTEDK